MHFNYLNKSVDGEFLDLYSKSVFKKIMFIKSLVFWKKNEKQNEIKFWKFVWACYTWNNCNLENAIFCLILPKYNHMQIQQLHNFYLPAVQLFVSKWQQQSTNCLSVFEHFVRLTFKGLIAIIIFAYYDLLLATNSTFITDSQYLSTIQIWWNLNEHHYYLTSNKSVICK